MKFNDKLFGLRENASVVSLGTILGPFFIIFVNDLPGQLTEVYCRGIVDDIKLVTEKQHNTENATQSGSFLCNDYQNRINYCKACFSNVKRVITLSLDQHLLD